MQVIETQFRIGEISYGEQKKEEVPEPNMNSVPVTTSGVKKNTHSRKRSVLVKDLDQQSRHSKLNDSSTYLYL